MPSPSSATLIRHLAELCPADLPAPLPPGLAPALQAATATLIDAMRAEGRLAEDPLTLAMSRSVALQAEAVARRLRGRRVLVTGGSGCVGTRLRRLIAGFQPAVLVNLDRVPHQGEGIWAQGDIRDPAELAEIFAATRPEVVFHLASIREPGMAERVVREAIETNVYGTRNVIEACQRAGVAHAVYSSTGKCYAYLTDHVYTASKKLAEAQWMAAARAEGPTLFAMTRFTHVLENGVVAREIAEGIEAGLVGLHGPDRHFNVQNLRQATHLLLNALALAGQQAPDSFWSAVDLGWPVNTLELALHQIAASGRPVGIRFLGVPCGYDESFFRGQFDWSERHDYHPLVNALEAPTQFADRSGTMIGARVAPCPPAALRAALAQLQETLTARPDDALAKQALLEAVRAVAAASLGGFAPARLLEILWWGAAPEWAANAAQMQRYRPIMMLFAEALLPALEDGGLRLEPGLQARLADLAASFAGIAGMEALAGRCAAAIRPLQAA
ncbi:polysaccharide biosynthesis protein [Roseomonas sp. 18066]|uniref:polysaccharide biosynthesis protein n=1 Tax=Roseomonas sp. 18066 TaxID=2681412 RepID=UPI0013569AB6|nr:polysaccharide biosynthesis protein [Roseomonas sp. 18066]